MAHVFKSNLAQLRLQAVALQDQANQLMQSLDALLVPEPSWRVTDDPNHWRRWPGGPLNDRGDQEINRRFASGQKNDQIVREMRIAPWGVANRRRMFNKVIASGGTWGHGRMWTAAQLATAKQGAFTTDRKAKKLLAETGAANRPG